MTSLTLAPLVRNGTLSYIAAACLVGLTGCAEVESRPAELTDGSAADLTTPAVRAEPPASPPTVGLDSRYLAHAFERLEALPRFRCLLVARHGEIQAERCFRGPGPDQYANVKSVSKSILSALVGIAIADGYLEGPHQPVLPFFREYVGAVTADDSRSRITVGNLLSMQSGLERTSGGSYGAWVQSTNWVRYAITRPIVAEPGTTRLYSTGNSHLLSAILTQATGRSTWEYARERLAEPMGIRLPRWLADPQGIYFGGNEMLLTPRDMIRFGELYRNEGRVGDQQVVPASWVSASLSPVTRSRSPRESYGYGWFLARIGDHDYFYAQGYGGQYIFVVPDLELTVVATSHPDAPRAPGHNREVHSIFRDLIVRSAVNGAAFLMAPPKPL